MSIPSAGLRSRVRSSRTARGSAPTPSAGSRGPMDLRPGPQQDLQPLARLLPADEDDAVARRPSGSAWGGRGRRSERSRSPGQPAAAALLASSETAMRWSMRSSRKPTMASRPHPAEVAARVKVPTTGARASASDATQTAGVIGSCRCSTSKPLAFERRPDPKDRPRAQDDVRQRPVRRDDDGAADRDHVRRRGARPAHPRVQHARELARWIVPHDRPVSMPSACRAAARSSACSTTAPQSDQASGTTIPTFIPHESTRACTMHRCSSKGSPRHADHRGRAQERRLLHPGAGAAAREEDRQPGRSDRLSPLLRGRARQRRLRHHLLRVSRAARGKAGRGCSTPVVWRIGSAGGARSLEPRLAGTAQNVERNDGTTFEDFEGVRHELRVTETGVTSRSSRNTPRSRPSTRSRASTACGRTRSTSRGAALPRTRPAFSAGDQPGGARRAAWRLVR